MRWRALLHDFGASPKDVHGPPPGHITHLDPSAPSFARRDPPRGAQLHFKRSSRAIRAFQPGTPVANQLTMATLPYGQQSGPVVSPQVRSVVSIVAIIAALGSFYLSSQGR